MGRRGGLAGRWGRRRGRCGARAAALPLQVELPPEPGASRDGFLEPQRGKKRKETEKSPGSKDRGGKAGRAGGWSGLRGAGWAEEGKSPGQRRVPDAAARR